MTVYYILHHCQRFSVILSIISIILKEIPKGMRQIYNSHSFRVLHDFLSIMFTIARSNPFTFLA